MFLFNKKAQSFDVFKLLIAGVVAIAILALLLSIINIINPPGRDPMEIIKGSMSELTSSPYVIKVLGSTSFKKGHSMSVYAIAEQSGGILDYNNCHIYLSSSIRSYFDCVSDDTSGGSSDSGTDSVVGQKCDIVTYKSPTQKNLTILGICGYGGILSTMSQTICNNFGYRQSCQGNDSSEILDISFIQDSYYCLIGVK